MRYKNSKSIVWLLYFAIVFFPVMSIASGYLAYDSYYSDGKENIVTFVIGFIFFGYLSPIGFKLFRFVKLEYALSDEGIEITDGENARFYPWSRRMQIKDSSRLQLFWLYDVNGNTIAMVDYMMPGYDEFSEFIRSKVQPSPLG